MSSLPREVLEDVLQPLDRWTLDAVQFISRRFLQLIMECMSEVCLRQIESGEFRAPSGNTSGSWHIDVDGPPGWEIRKDTTRPFSEFAQALQSSRVGYLMFRELVFTAELATLVLQTPIIAKVLNFHGGSCAQLTPTQLRKVLVHFSPTALYLESCGLRVCHLSDELFRAMFKKCLRYTFLRELEPIDGDVFCVTNDLVVDFCMQQDVQVIEAPSDSPPASPSRRIPHAELNLKDGTFTKDLFKRLVEVSTDVSVPQFNHV
ncbi:hypothetical protein AAVH_09436 [Aphelenchoides avenae]|nr:hypothetical protein AAVH_09436 [Aphelenchus avenae]